MKTLLCILALASGCATAQQSGTIAADGLLGVSKATRVVYQALPKSALTATVVGDFVHLAVALKAVAELVPATCAATPSAAFATVEQAVMDAFALLLRDLGPTVPHGAALARLKSVEDLRLLGLAVSMEILAGHAPHTAALSAGEITGIVSAILGGVAALVPSGIAIYNATKTPGTPDACSAAAKALQDDVATLPAAIGGS